MSTLGGPAQQAQQVLQQRKQQRKKKGTKQPKIITIDGQNLTFTKTLGQGAYGKVDKVEDDEGHSYAIKRVEFYPDKGVFADIIKEMDILRRFAGHPNIIGLCGYAWRDEEFLVLMEYGGTPLHKYIGHVDYEERMNLLPMVMWQTMSALSFLHSRGVCHRDVKPDNILVEEFVEDDGFIQPYLRLCDFGLSKNMTLKRNTPKTSTLWYRAPENLQKLDRYSYKIDVWAAGCLLYEYVTGEVLFECESSNQCLLQIISSLGPLSAQTFSRLQIDKSKLPKRMRRHIIRRIADTEVEKLMFRMLTVDPDTRPTAEQILQDDFFIRNERNVGKIARIRTFVDKEQRHREEDQASYVQQDLVPNPAYSPEIRQALVQWLLDVQTADREETHPQTVFLGIDLFDEVMSKWGPIEQDSDLKYIALTCLNIASKYLELGLDLDFVYCWNFRKFKESQGVPSHKVQEPSEEEVDEYILNLNSYEQRCLLLVDFRIGGRVTALDRNNGNYKNAAREVTIRRVAI